MENKIKFTENEIILIYSNGEILKFRIQKSSVYKVGDEFIDYNGNRFFLIKELI